MFAFPGPTPLTLGACLLWAGAVSGAVAQEPPTPTVAAARLSAAVDPATGRADVTIAYGVSDGAARSVRIEALDFGPAAVREVRLEGVGSPVVLDAESGRLRAAELPVASPGDSIVVSYTVDGAVQGEGADVRLRVPVVVVDFPPHTADGPVFHAVIDVPDGWAVSGSFPTGLSETADGTWEVDLAVVPSLVSLRARTDGIWRPGLPVVLDGLALVALLAFGLFGVRHLRGVVRRAEADA